MFLYPAPEMLAMPSLLEFSESTLDYYLLDSILTLLIYPTRVTWCTNSKSHFSDHPR